MISEKQLLNAGWSIVRYCTLGTRFVTNLRFANTPLTSTLLETADMGMAMTMAMAMAFVMATAMAMAIAFLREQTSRGQTTPTQGAL